MRIPLTISRLPQWRPRILVPGLVVGLVWLTLGLGRLPAQASEAPASLEYEVKGAFLVKFLMFTEWPGATTGAEPRKIFTIGILGADPFGAGFDEAVRKVVVNGRPVQLKRADAPTELDDCQIVFICASEVERMLELLQAFSGKGVLTVADMPEFARSGGMIGFIKEQGRVRFEINVAAAEKSGIKLSSKLLQVGKRVTGTAATTPG